jgi:hypothetical protein
MISNTAFEFLRSQKNVEPATEDFVLRRLKGKCTGADMLTAFENGIGGQYGKVYSLDAATLIGWVEKHQQSKNSSRGYMETGLLNPEDPRFDLTNDDWIKEANKCFTSFLNGVSESHFHPFVYDRMMLDQKIDINAYLKHFREGDDERREVVKAKQLVLRDVFLTYKSNGWTQVYLIR